MEAVLKKNTPGVQYTSTVMGISVCLSLTRTSYNAFYWVSLQPWEDRKNIDGAVPGHQSEVEPSSFSPFPPGHHLSLSPHQPLLGIGHLRVVFSLCLRIEPARIPSSW